MGSSGSLRVASGTDQSYGVLYCYDRLLQCISKYGKDNPDTKQKCMKFYNGTSHFINEHFDYCRTVAPNFPLSKCEGVMVNEYYGDEEADDDDDGDDDE